ncbi:hypothetical protein L211DRAFT_338628 [Terfezia boudieri ATCC MYA-4762]|uniref:HNH nuclease domain-containing protein n=1 Tax=Terfezia boudieri ATCC MYA-4762 TaxID=1051890 RepID=A0A3N4LI67_9PEZI|nr:hypothetical protein L211DRAFT_338628 [Terfezia boudieri ATCC MYA-4762]
MLFILTEVLPTVGASVEIRSCGKVCITERRQVSRVFGLWQSRPDLLDASRCSRRLFTVRQCGRSSGSSASDTATLRSSWAINWERDNNLCVLSLSSDPEVAHIVPYSIGRYPRLFEEARPDVFQFLNIPGRSIDKNQSIGILVCLDPANHTKFGRGLFVLEPVGDPLACLGDHGQLWSYESKIFLGPSKINLQCET